MSARILLATPTKMVNLIFRYNHISAHSVLFLGKTSIEKSRWFIFFINRCKCWRNSGLLGYLFIMKKCIPACSPRVPKWSSFSPQLTHWRGLAYLLPCKKCTLYASNLLEIIWRQFLFSYLRRYSMHKNLRLKCVSLTLRALFRYFIWEGLIAKPLYVIAL